MEIWRFATLSRNVRTLRGMCAPLKVSFRHGSQNELNRRVLALAYARPMPTLECVLQALHESEIRCGIQNEPPAGGITAWMDCRERTERATFLGSIVGGYRDWPADTIVTWLHQTA